MMRIGRHTNVVHLYEVLEMVQDSKSTMFLILELVRGGELFDLISSNSSSKRKNARGGNGVGGSGCNNENELHEFVMRKFFWELASGISFIHSCGVAHRDLKPEVRLSKSLELVLHVLIIISLFMLQFHLYLRIFSSTPSPRRKTSAQDWITAY